MSDVGIFVMKTELDRHKESLQIKTAELDETIQRSRLFAYGKIFSEMTMSEYLYSGSRWHADIIRFRLFYGFAIGESIQYLASECSFRIHSIQ